MMFTSQLWCDPVHPSAVGVQSGAVGPIVCLQQAGTNNSGGTSSTTLAVSISGHLGDARRHPQRQTIVYWAVVI